MRIGLVSPYALDRPGGVQRVVTDLATRLKRMDHEVLVIDPPTLGLKTEVVTANASRAPITLDLAAFRRTRRALAPMDVVHVHEPLMPTMGWAGLGAGRPFVATFHADPSRWVRALYRTPGLRMLLRDGLLTTVSDTAARALPTRWGATTTIPNGIEVDAYRAGGDRDARLVTFLGRDEPRKGLDILLAAWERVVEQVPDGRLVVMGARRPTRLARVEFVGEVDEAEKIRRLGRASVLVAPNLRGESFGLVGLEAMAAGCAVVASDLPAFRSVLGEAALYFPVGEPAALATALTGILLDPATITHLTTRAAERVRLFDLEAVTETYLAAYREAIEKRSRRTR